MPVVRHLVPLAACLLLMGGARAQTAADREVRTPNAGDLGIFDPSLARDPAGDRLWMAHAIVRSAPAPGEPGRRAVSIGLSWQATPDGQWRSTPGPLAATLPVTARGRAALWQAEVPTLFHDPGAPPGARWKLLYHRYLHLDRRRFEHGWIALKEAATPAALARAPEIKLLTARGYRAVNDDAAGWTRTPVAGPPRIAVHIAWPQLRHCAALTEPGAQADAHTVRLSLSCSEPRLFRPPRPRLVMLACTQPCRYGDIAAWRVVETPARVCGGSGCSSPPPLTASEIAPLPDGLLLLVSPLGRRPFANAYLGCEGYLLPGAGAPGVPARRVLRLRSAAPVHHGACDYLARDARRGVLFYSRLDLAPRPRFRILRRALAIARPDRGLTAGAGR